MDGIQARSVNAPPTGVAKGRGFSGRWRGAYSLIEVAVTCVSLAVLTLCLIPALGSVATSSKQSRCLSNLGQIGYANAVYAAQDAADMAIPVHGAQFTQDPNDPIHIGAYEWGGKSGVGQTDYVTGTPGGPVNSRYGTQAGFGPARRPLNGIVYGDAFPDHTDDPGDDNVNWLSDTTLDLDVYRCPSDSGYAGLHCPDFRDERRTAYDHFGTSYAANMFMIGSSAGGYMWSNSPYLHGMSQIISPATTLAYQEGNGRFAWAAAPDWCSFLPGVPGTVRGWHGKDWTFSAAFVDGHADTIYMRGYQSYRLGRYPPFDSDDDGVPDYDGSYSIYSCVIIRGDGWQKDTLPAPFVFTGLWPTGFRPSYEDCISE